MQKFRELDTLSKYILSGNTFEPYKKSFENMAVDMNNALEKLYQSGWGGDRVAKEFPNLAMAIKL